MKPNRGKQTCLYGRIFTRDFCGCLHAQTNVFSPPRFVYHAAEVTMVGENVHPRQEFQATASDTGCCSVGTTKSTLIDLLCLSDFWKKAVAMAPKALCQCCSCLFLFTTQASHTRTVSIIEYSGKELRFEVQALQNICPHARQ